MKPVPWELLPDSSELGDAGELVIGGCSVLDLADEYGTPLFIYDETHLRQRCRDAVELFGRHATYATKAFLCKAMAKLANDEGMTLDVATAGEFHIARAAGVPAADLVFHGNNKSVAELRMAIREGVGRIVVDSFDELNRLDSLHAQGHGPPKVLLRVTPGVEAHTHEFIATGQDDSKFGFTVSTGVAAKAVERAGASEAVNLVGIHAHIGSQVFRVESFAQSLQVLAEFSEPFGLAELVVGGGLGVPYVAGEEAPTIRQWGQILKREAAQAGITATLGIEPGRSIAAGAAITAYTVGTIKRLDGIRNYVAVDGGMSDNPRPVLYGSGYETFLPRAVAAERPFHARIVGKHCESGDILVREGLLPADTVVGDVLATPVTGAYGHSMGSNYNKVLRPPVVFCENGDARMVVRRETLADLLTTDLT
ncbi:MAG: diaminopimelate decarboxylase [Acidimicrobiales bacterium]|nr:diaminopimelate decarboxylase [Acidimicrobiales bacterium]